ILALVTFCALAPSTVHAADAQDWPLCRRGSDELALEVVIRRCTAVLGANPSQERKVVAYFNRGVAYQRMEWRDSAIADYNEVLKLTPDDSCVLSNRGLVYSEKGQHDLAIVDFDHALKLDPDNAAAYLNRGLARYGKKEYARAVEDYT